MSRWRTLVSLALLAGLAFAEGAPNSGATPLRARAEAQGAAIRLVDFLPRDAPAVLLAEARQIILGDAPQPGSLRAFSREQVLAKVGAMGGRLSVPSRLIIVRHGFPIAVEQVALAISQFLHARGWQQESPAKEWLRWSAPPAADPDPRLTVIAASWSTTQRNLQFEIRCADHLACAPFLVAVCPPASQSAAWAERFRANPFLLHEAETASAVRTSAREPVLVRAGSTVILLLDGPGMRIRLQVVCLERGRKGQRIRAQDKFSHRIFRAEVDGVDSLRAVF